MDRRWLFAVGPHHTKYVHRAEAGKSKGSHGGKKQYGLSTDPPKGNPSGQGGGSASST